MEIAEPKDAWTLIGKSGGGILSVYGGELEFNRFSVTLKNRLGENRDAVLRYGKNLYAFGQDENCGDVFTGIFPYWKNKDGDLTTLPEKTVSAAGSFNHVKIKSVDFSSYFEDTPTPEQLRLKAADYIQKNNIGIPEVSITLGYVQLNHTMEYPDAAPENISIGDTVTVIFEKMMVTTTARVIKTRYNVLSGRYESVSIGRVKRTISDTISKQIKNSESLFGSVGALGIKIADVDEKTNGIRMDTNQCIADIGDVTAGLYTIATADDIEGLKKASTTLFAKTEEEYSGLELHVKDNDEEIKGLKESTAKLTTRVTGAETTLEMVSRDVGDLQEASADLTARVSGAETSLNLKAERETVEELDGRIETIETAQADLTARVTGAEAALNLKAERKTVEELDGRVSTVESAQADLTARVTGAESALNLKADSKTVQALNGRVETIETASADLTARVTGAESALNLKAERKTVEELDGRVTTVESASADLTARVTGAESALKLKADSKTVQSLNGRVTTIESASADLTARVTGAESALNLKADSKTVKALNGRVTTVESAQADLAARVTGAESSLSLKADSKTVKTLEGRVSTVESAQASLAARVTGAEASLDLKADSDTVKTLDGQIKTVEESQASLTSRVGQAQAMIVLNARNISEHKAELDGLASSVATIQADVIDLQGRVDVTGSLSVSDGIVNVTSNLFVGGSITSYANYIGVGGNYYEPKQITSTSGTVLVLGTA